MKILAVYHLKGGTGKTSIAVNLSYLAAESGLKTLLADLDPQGAASFYFQLSPRKKAEAGHLIKGGGRLSRDVMPTAFAGLDVLPADTSLRKLERILADSRRTGKSCTSSLRSLAKGYDLLILDCPPGISDSVRSFLNAADNLLIPLIPTPLSLQAFASLQVFFPKWDISAQRVIRVWSMVQSGKKIHRESMDLGLSGKFRTAQSTIPFSAEIEEMGIRMKPVCYRRRRSPASLAFRSLFAELRKEEIF